MKEGRGEGNEGKNNYESLNFIPPYVTVPSKL